MGKKRQQQHCQAQLALAPQCRLNRIVWNHLYGFVSYRRSTIRSVYINALLCPPRCGCANESHKLLIYIYDVSRSQLKSMAFRLAAGAALSVICHDRFSMNKLHADACTSTTLRQEYLLLNVMSKGNGNKISCDTPPSATEHTRTLLQRTPQ